MFHVNIVQGRDSFLKICAVRQHYILVYHREFLTILPKRASMPSALPNENLIRIFDVIILKYGLWKVHITILPLRRYYIDN